MRTRALTLNIMRNILHETCGSKDIDLQAENDRLREIIQVYKVVEKENVHLICKLEEQLDASHKELHYCKITHPPKSEAITESLLNGIKECYISNGDMWAYMGWDLKHGPTEAEWNALPDEVTTLLSTPRQRVPLQGEVG